MLVSKTISMHLDDMSKIQDKINKGEFKSVSEFVQKAIKNELRGN